jgi:hypothetical protein
MEIKGKDDDKNLNIAREIFSAFREKFYSTGGSNLKALEESLDFLKTVITQRGVEADVVAGNLWGSVFYVAKLGKGGVLLVRDGQAKKIDISKVASGVLRDRDSVILADTHFLENTELANVGQVASGEDFENAVKVMTEGVKEKEGYAFCLRLSVQEPVEVLQPVLMADLDKTGKKGTEEGHEAWSIAGERKWPTLLRSLSFRFVSEKWPKVKVYLVRAGEVLRGLARKASFVILSPWLPKTVGSFDDPAIRKRRQIFQIVVLLVAILIISIVVGTFNHNRRMSRERYEESITLIENKLDDAENLQSINAAQAAAALADAQSELEKLSTDDERVAYLKKQLDSLFAKINKIYRVELKLVADLAALKGGIDTNEIKLASGSLFVLDSGTGSIYKVGVSGKNPLIFVSEKKNLQNFGIANDFVYAQTKNEILKVAIETGVEANVAGASSDWKTLISADTYRSNFYLLDSKAKQVWKYLPAGTGLGNPQPYFAKEFKGTPTSFAVDGAVWVVTKDKIFKFFGGNEDKFSVQDSPKGFSDITDIYTSEGLANLYVLDKGAGGVFVIEKSSGKYRSFYKASGINEAEALTVDEAKKTIYLLVNNEVKFFKLK